MPRPKRTPEEIRSLLMASAVHCFAGQGFARTTTRQIAADAGVSEVLLFRHFGNKAGMFEASVVEPFKQALNAHVDKWDSPPADVPIEDITADFVKNVYGLLCEHRDIVLALTAAYAHEQDAGANVAALFADSMDRITNFVVRLNKARGYERVDAEVAVQAVVSMVIGMSMMDGLLLRPGRSPSPDRRVREMTQLIVHGITHRGR